MSKALLDLIHLQPGGDDPTYLQELRLQNLAQLDLDALARLAGQSYSPKLSRAAAQIAELAQARVQNAVKAYLVELVRAGNCQTVRTVNVSEQGVFRLTVPGDGGPKSVSGCGTVRAMWANNGVLTV